MIGHQQWCHVHNVTSAGSSQRCFGLIQSQRALAEQRSPCRSSAGCQSRLPDQTEAGGSTPSPDHSDTCCHHHPGENTADHYSRRGSLVDQFGGVENDQMSGTFTSSWTVQTSNLQQVCPVKRIWWIWLSALSSWKYLKLSSMFLKSLSWYVKLTIMWYF